LSEHYEKVKGILTKYSEAVEEMARVLLEVEVIEGSKVREIIADFEERNGMPSMLAHAK
jgi:cell division protease FtsH